MKKYMLVLCVLSLGFTGSLYAEEATTTTTTEESEGKSEAIESLSYDKDTKVLTVVFERGTYEYSDVPADVYEAFKNSESQGTYYREFIKGKYTSTKLND